MRKCKYCGRELKENERCNCPGAQAMRRKVRLIAIIAGVLVIAAIIIAIIVGANSGNSSDHPSSETTSQDNASPETEHTGNEITSTPEGTAADDPTTNTPDETESEEITSADQANLIDPFEYWIAEPDYDKYNGVGKASVTPNNDALLVALIGEKPSVEDLEAYLNYIDKCDEYETAIRAIRVEVSPNDGLSNKDKIKVKVTVPEFLKDKVMSTSKTFEVSGLPDIQKVDILSKFEFKAVGVSGEAEIDVNPVTGDEYLLKNLLLIEPREYLSSGDTYTITVTDDYCEYLIKNYGIMPSSTTVTRKVESLPEYVTSADQLPKNILLDLAQSLIEAEEKPPEGDGFTYGNAGIYGCYYVSRKPDAQGGYRNVVDIVISCDRFYREEYESTWYSSLRLFDVALEQKDSVASLYYKSKKYESSFTGIDLHMAEYGDNYTITEINLTE